MEVSRGTFTGTPEIYFPPAAQRYGSSRKAGTGKSKKDIFGVRVCLNFPDEGKKDGFFTYSFTNKGKDIASISTSWLENEKISF